jgi:hypothetical protein
MRPAGGYQVSAGLVRCSSTGGNSRSTLFGKPRRPDIYIETTLAAVLARILRGSDTWADFAGHYLTALDQADTAAPEIYGISSDYTRQERTGNLADFHLLLLGHLDGNDAAEGLLDRLVAHPKLAGPELTHLQARRALQTGDPGRARELMRDCLEELPGHEGFLAFAKEISAH